MYGAARVCSSIEGGQFADYEPSIYWRKVIRGHEHQATARGRVTAENGASHYSCRFRQGARAATAFPPYHDDLAMPKLPPAPGGTCELPADSCVAFRTVGQGGRQ